MTKSSSSEYNPIQGDIFAFLDAKPASNETDAHVDNGSKVMQSKKKKGAAGLDLNSEELFPTLGSPTEPIAPSTWGKTSVAPSNLVTQSFELPVEQQKPLRSEGRDKAPKSIGQVCAEIGGRTRTSIDASTSSRTRSMTFIIRGKAVDVAEAKRQLWNEVAQSMTSHVEVPSELLGSVIGAGGKVLQAIMAETGTKITVPRPDYPGYILVTGDGDGVAAARARVRAIIDEKQKKLVERVELKAHLLPFVYGVPSAKVGEQAQVWSERHSIRISQEIDREQDEAVISFSGDRDDVRLAMAEFSRLLEEQKRVVRSVSTSVPKALHRFLVGPKGSTLLDLETETGCSVLVPGPASGSDQVTIVGPQDKLFKGLSAVMDKTGSVASEVVKMPGLLVALLQDRCRRQIQELQNVSVSTVQEGFQVSGFKNEVPQAIQALEKLALPYMGWTLDDSFETDPAYFASKQGLTQLQTAHGVHIVPIGDTGKILIAGPNKAAVQAAKSDLGSFVASRSDLSKTELDIENKYHRLLMGRDGANVVKYGETFPTLRITFGIDSVTLQGRSSEVQAAKKQLLDEVKGLVVHEEIVNVPARHLVDGKGALQRWITAIGREHDVHLETQASGKVKIQGVKKAVEVASKAIVDRATALENQGSTTVDLDHAYHSMLIGKGGKNVRHLDRRHGVQLRFPSPDAPSPSDTITIVGPKQNLEAAKAELVELYEQILAHGHSAELPVPRAALSRIVGRKGETIEGLQLDTDTRIDIQSDAAEGDKSILVIRGTEKGIKEAVRAIQALVQDAEKEAVEAVPLDSAQATKLQGVANGAFRSLSLDGVQFSLRPDRVLVRGETKALPAACQLVNDLLTRLDQFVQETVEIPSKQHGSIIGAGGKNVQALSRKYNVRIDIPRSSGGVGSGDDVITVSGLPSDIQSAIAALKACVREERRIPIPSHALRTTLSSQLAQDHPIVKCIVTRDGLVLQGAPTNLEAAMASLTFALAHQTTTLVAVPKHKHRLLIGQQGRTAKAIREASGADMVVPAADSAEETVKLVGSPEAIAKAQQEIGRILAE